MVQAERSAEEMFKELNSRMTYMGLPFADLVGAAEYEQRLGREGALVELPPDEQGPGAIVIVKSETVDFKVGGLGPYVLNLAAAQRLIEPPEAAAL